MDILYLAYNRLEFTRKSFGTLLANTDWSHVERLIVYDDGSTDGTREYLSLSTAGKPICGPDCTVIFRMTEQLGPVGIMNDYLISTPDDGMFAKIDNDTMVPPGWLNECLSVMKDGRVDLLGLEAMHPLGSGPRGFRESDYIGGIGLMRRRAFSGCLPAPNGRFGFTAWQQHHPSIIKGWLFPAIPVCLLNLVPFDPWISLSREYIAKGWQRDWPEPMPLDRTAYWEWWA